MVSYRMQHLVVYSEFTIVLEESACFHAEVTRVNSSEVF
jgi:hypothetical protein